MKRPNVNILYICVIFALITLFSCKGKGGTYRDGVFYPNDEKLAGSKKVTKPDGHEYIMFYNRDGTPQSGEGMHHPTCKKCKQLEKTERIFMTLIALYVKNGTTNTETTLR